MRDGTLTALVALGSNVASAGDSPRAMVEAAVEGMRRSGLAVTSVSPLYATPAWPPGAGPDFVNAACALQTDLGPADLLRRLHAIERDLGRERHERWAPRTIDIDLLALDALVLPDAETQTRWRELSPERQRREAPTGPVLPHPRLQDRAFVLVPLADVAPDWRHPILGRTVREMLRDLPPAALEGVRRI